VQVDFAFLCDAATESGGKLYALGVGIDRLQVTELPARQGRITVVVRLSFDAFEQGDRGFAIRVVGADGHALAGPIAGAIPVALPPGRAAAKANLLVELLSLEFTAAGPHEVTLAIDGEQAVSLPLEVAIARA